MSTPETTEGVGEIHNRLGSNTTNAATVSDGSSGLSPELLAMDPLMLQRFEQFLKGTTATC